MAKDGLTNDPMVRIARKQRHLRQIEASGSYFITDCFPWAIKAGCQRQDCPMRFQALPDESTPDAYHLACNPTGDLADLLITLQRVRVPE